MAKFFWDYMRAKPAFLPERLTPIEEALEWQEYFLNLQMDALSHKEITPMNFILFAEHESVYCFPKKDEEILMGPARREKLLKPGTTLADLPAPYHCVAPIKTAGESGEIRPCEYSGSITYHGPGQLVCYLILNMTALGFTGETLPRISKIIDDAVKEFLRGLDIRAYRLIELLENSDPEIEQSLLIQKAIWKDENGKKHDAHAANGLWVIHCMRAKKIMSRALATVPYCYEISDKKKRDYFICFGFALNISTDLSYFDFINPCGLPLEITSVEAEIGKKEKIYLYKSAKSIASLLVQKICDATGDNSHILI